MAYLNAGAQCLISASYQATIPGFQLMGIDQHEAETLILKSVDLANEAIDVFMESHDVKVRPLVAASIGPYGAFLADGSEYKGKYEITDEELLNFHDPKIKILDQSVADFLAFETIPSFQEARVLAELLPGIKKKAWISFSCKNESEINDGTPIEKCVELFKSLPTVFAVGANCTNPKYISGLIKKIRVISNGKRIIVYPNSGESYDSNGKSWSESGYVDTVLPASEWYALGADIIGGCCRVGPSEIKAMGQSLCD